MVRNSFNYLPVSQQIRLQVMVPEHLLKIIWEERDKAGYQKTSDFLRNVIAKGLASSRHSPDSDNPALKNLIALGIAFYRASLDLGLDL